MRNVPVMSVIDVQDVAWDLEPLVEGEGPDGADRMLAEADERAAAFAARYAGRVGVQRDERVEVLGGAPRAQDQALGLDRRMDHRPEPSRMGLRDGVPARPLNQGDAVPSHLRYRPPGRSAKGAPGSGGGPRNLGASLFAARFRVWGEPIPARSAKSRTSAARDPQTAEIRTFGAPTRNVPVMSVIDVQDVAWDLDPLVDGEGPEGVDRMLAEADERAATFAARYAGHVAELDGPGLAEAMAELQAIAELVARAGNYGHLRFAVVTIDPANGALVARVSEKATAVETKLLFFDLEWAAVDDERADELLGADGLDTSRHHLRTVRRYRPYLLSEPEEKIMTEKAVSGREAWSRLFEEQTSAIKVDTPGDEEPVKLDVALSRLLAPDRELRRTTAEAVTAALAPNLRTRAYIYNTIAQDKATDDRLRGFPSWISSRNLANEASDESVQALVEAVRSNYDLPQRWYRLKANLLGLDRLADYDRSASIATEEVQIGWPEATEIVLSSFNDFSPTLHDTAKRFFDEHWIDAPVRPGKRGGGRSS